MANLTQTALADAIKTQYEKRLLSRAIPRMIHGRWLVQARLSKMGSYELRKYGSLSAVTSAVTEGTTPTEQSAPSLTKVTLTPLFYGAWIGYTDELDLTAYDPYVSEVSGILGEQAGLSADTIIRDVLVAGATIDYAGTAAARTDIDMTADKITYAEFINQLAALEAAGAMPVDGEDFACIIHPHTWATLMQDATFVNMFHYESSSGKESVIRSGYLGRVLRCKIYVTSNAKEYVDGGTTGADVYATLFIGREAAGQCGFGGGLDPNIVDNQGVDGKPLTGQQIKPVELIMKPLGSAGADDPLNQRGTIAWKMALDVEMTNAAWMRSLEHATTFSDIV